MCDVIIREVELEDVSAIKEVITSAWEWAELVESNKTLEALIGIYFNKVLHRGTFGRVAVLKGKVIGVVFAEIYGHTPKYRMFMDDGSDHALALIEATEVERNNVYEYFTKNTAYYKQLSEKAQKPYDGTLNFLVLSKEARGKDIGKLLWNTAKDYFEENGAKSIYLYTDSECTFKFYEGTGFTRRCQQKAEFLYEGEYEVLTQFLYEYNLGKSD